MGVQSGMLTSTQFAEKHDLSRQRINQLIQEGRISPKPVLTQVLGGPKRGVWLFKASAKIKA